MTSEGIRDPLADPLLTSQNSALVVIDYRSNQVQTVSSIDHELLVRTIISVARLAPAFDLPIVHRWRRRQRFVNQCRRGRWDFA